MCPDKLRSGENFASLLESTASISDAPGAAEKLAVAQKTIAMLEALLIVSLVTLLATLVFICWAKTFPAKGGSGTFRSGPADYESVTAAELPKDYDDEEV